MKPRARKTLAPIAALTALALSCADGGRTRAPSSEPSAQPAALIGGMPPGELAAAGLVEVAGAGVATCSGVLLTHSYVLTAQHCLCDAHLPSPYLTALRQGEIEGAALSMVPDMNAVMSFGKPIDLTFMHTDRMLPLAERQKLFTGMPAELVGRTLTCYSAADGGARVEAEVLSAGADLGVPEVVPAGCATPRPVDGVEIQLPQGVVFDRRDAGGPCYVTEGSDRFLVGLFSMQSPADGTRVFVQTLEQKHTFLYFWSDIQPASTCDAPLADSRFALDPQVFMGVPMGGGAMVVAAHAYDEPERPRTLVQYGGGYRLELPWTRIAPPSFARGVRSLRASVDPEPTPFGSPFHMLELMYTDDDDQLHVLWNDVPGARQWLQREQVTASEPFVPFDGVGPRFSPEQPRGGLDLSVRMPLFVTREGRVATSRYLNETDGWVDMPLPEDAPLADARRPPTLIMHAFTQDMTAGYFDLAGEFVIHRGSLDRVLVDGARNVWFDEPSIVTDLPRDVRDVAISVVGLSRAENNVAIPIGDLHWAVATAHDGAMRLYSLDRDTGHAVDYGALGAKAVGHVKLLPYDPAPPFAKLYASYTGEDFFAHVRPVGNCLGNSPPGYHAP